MTPDALEELFPLLFWSTARLLPAPQLRRIAEALGRAPRRAVGACLAAGPTPDASELPREKRSLLAEAYPAGDPPPGRLAAHYPEILVATCAAVGRQELEQILAPIPDAFLAAQSRALGGAGRARAFGAMDRALVEVILRRTPERVLLQATTEALAGVNAYAATLHKQERVGGKLQGVEVIQVKLRQRPRAFYMRWLHGPFSGRQVLYNEQVLGPGRIRVREGGLLGLKALTLAVDSPLAQRGTLHRADELGLHYLVETMVQDQDLAGPRGHLRRVDHGMVQLDGRWLYKLESLLPDDPALGYYCPRMVHYTDFVRSLEVRFEIFDFHGHLSEVNDYLDLDLEPGLTDRDFDPKNRAYRL